MDDYASPPAPVKAVALARSSPAPWARIGFLGIAVAALIAAAILAFGATATPKSILAAGTSSDSSTIVEDLNGFGGPGGDRGPGGHGFGGVTITSLTGSSISLKTADGWTRTITVDSGTTYSKSGATIALGDLKVGDEIGFRQTRETDGSFTIDSISVILPRVGGEVTAVSGTTITVKQRDDSSATIKVTGDTTYTVAGAAGALADVKVGMSLTAEGTLNSDGSLTATAVRAGTSGDHGPGDHGPGDRGPGDRGFHGGGFGHDDHNPNATAAPSATSSAG